MNPKPQSPLRIGIHTLGCRLNQYESDGIMQDFIKSGLYEAASIEDGPDVAIINTCTVTEQANARSRQVIRRVLKKNPKSKVVLTGCYAQTDPEKLRLPGLTLIVGNQYKSSLFEILKQIGLEQKEDSPDSLYEVSKDGSVRKVDKGVKDKMTLEQSSKELSSQAPLPKKDKPRPLTLEYGERPVLNQPFAYGYVKPFQRARAYLKIQEGCDKKCTYCKIPMARGRGLSRSYTDILEHVDTLEEYGVKEIILTGVNLGWYRDTQEGITFIALLEKILNRLKSARLRLSSIEPCDVDGPLAELSLHPRFCDFLHVPLQSGSQRILRAMRRSYSPYSFQKRIEKVKALNPNIFLGTDLIIGFPGEKEADFQESLDLCSDLGFAGIHAFRFSSRSGTPAAHFEEQIPLSLMRERMGRVQDLRLGLWRSYAQKQEGKIAEGIIEKIGLKNKDGLSLAEALTSNYLRVIFSIHKGQKTNKGQKIKLRLGSRNKKENYKLEASLAA